MRTVVAVFALATLVVSACGGGMGDVAAPPDGREAGARAVAPTSDVSGEGLTETAAELSTSSPARGDGAENWGPLAVVESDVTTARHEVGVRGTLRVEDRCVWLAATDSSDGNWAITLVWPNSSTSWDSADQAVIFNGQKLRDGDEVLVSGEEEAGVRWIAPLAPSCPKETFQVQQVDS